MATELEEKITNLIQGYEQLEAISNQIPVDTLNMASSYRRNLTQNTEILSKKDHDELAVHSRQLQKARNDLQGMAYERVVIDVITRDAVLSAKRGKRKPGSSNQSTTRTPRYNSSRFPSAAEKRTVNKEMPPVADTSVNDPIPIPSYNDRKQPKPKVPLTGPTDSRSSGGAGVGRVSTGVVPAEIANLRTTPVPVNPASAKKPTTRRPILGTKKTKALQDDMKALKSHVAERDSRQHRDMKAQEEQIKTLAKTVQSQGADIRTSVKDALQSVVDTLKPQLNTTSRTARSSVMSTQSRRPVLEEVIADEPSGYKVLTARPSSSSAAASTGADISALSKQHPLRRDGRAGSGSLQKMHGDDASHNTTLQVPDSPAAEGAVSAATEEPASYGDCKGTGQSEDQVGDAIAARGDEFILVMDSNGSRWERVKSSASSSSPVKSTGQTYTPPERPVGGTAGIQDSRYANAPDVAAVIGTTSDGNDELIELYQSYEQGPRGMKAAPSAGDGTHDRAGPSGLLSIPDFSTPYSDPPVHLPDGLGEGGMVGGGSNEEIEREFGNHRLVRPCVSRVKIHSGPPAGDRTVNDGNGGDNGTQAAVLANEQTVREEDDADTTEKLSRPAPASNDMMKLLELLVATQQQTLQGHNELMSKILANQTTGVPQSQPVVKAVPKHVPTPPAVAAAAATRFAAAMAGADSDDSSDRYSDDYDGEVIVEGDFVGGGGSAPNRMPARAAAAPPVRAVTAGNAPSTIRFADVLMGAVSSSSDGDTEDGSMDGFLADPTIRVPDPSGESCLKGDMHSVHGDDGLIMAGNESSGNPSSNPAPATITVTDKPQLHLSPVVHAAQAVKKFGKGAQPPKAYATSFGRLLAEGWHFGANVAKEKAFKAQDEARDCQGEEDIATHGKSVKSVNQSVEGRGGSTLIKRQVSSTHSTEEFSVPDVLYNAFAGRAARVASQRMPNLSTVKALREDASGNGGGTTGPQSTTRIIAGHDLSIAGSSSVHVNEAGVIADVMVKALQQLMSTGAAAVGASSPVLSTYTDRTKTKYDDARTYHGRYEPTHWNRGKDTTSGFNESGYYGHFAGNAGKNTRRDWRGQYNHPHGYPHRNDSRVRSFGEPDDRGRRSRSVPHLPSRSAYHSQSDSDGSVVDHVALSRERQGQRQQRRRGRSDDGMAGRRDKMMDRVREDMRESEHVTHMLAAGRFPNGQAVNTSSDASLDDSGDYADVPLDQVDKYMRMAAAATSSGAAGRGGRIAKGTRGKQLNFTSDPNEHWYGDTDYGTLSSTNDIGTSGNAKYITRKDRTRAAQKHNAYDRSSAARKDSDSLLPKPLVSGVLPSSATMGAMRWDVNTLLGDSDSNLSSTGAQTSIAAPTGVSDCCDSETTFLHKPFEARPLPVPLQTNAKIAGTIARGKDSEIFGGRFPNRLINLAAIDPNNSYSSVESGKGQLCLEKAVRARKRVSDEDGLSFSDTARSSDSFVSFADDSADGDSSYRDIIPLARGGSTSSSRGNVGLASLQYTKYGPTPSDYEPSTPTLSRDVSLVSLQRADESDQSDDDYSDMLGRGKVESAGGPSACSDSDAYDSTSDLLITSESNIDGAISSSEVDVSAADSENTDDVDSSLDSNGGIAGVLRSIAEANRSKVHVDRSKLTLWQPQKRR